MNRGLFSNEAGQGSAPIAHAAARADEPVSEGMVSILEPFIDTLCICTLTGIVILASGVWKEKVPNTFQGADMQIVTGAWNDTDPAHRSQLYGYLAGDAASAVKAFDGELRLVDGRLVGAAATFLNARSVAEDVEVRDASGAALTGLVAVRAGKLADASLRVTGNSLIHSAQLTTEAFSRGLFGDFGRTIVAVALLLFAFSTAIAWSYYGDRAMVYLFGLGSVKYYHLVYVVGFFLASFSDTTLIWNLASVAVVLMTLPNLLGLVLLRREIKDTLRDYLAKDGGK